MGKILHDNHPYMIITCTRKPSIYRSFYLRNTFLLACCYQDLYAVFNYVICSSRTESLNP